MAVVAARAHRRLEYTRAPSGASDASRRHHPVQTEITSPATQCSRGSRAGLLVIAHGKGIKQRQLFVPIQGVKWPWEPALSSLGDASSLRQKWPITFSVGTLGLHQLVADRQLLDESKVPFQHSGTFISNRYLHHQTR